MAGVILSASFFCWNAYLSRVHATRGSSTTWWQAPPLVPSNLWLRAHGRFFAILMVVFWTWSSFLSNNFWVRGPPLLSFILLRLNSTCGGYIGSGESTRDPGVCDVVMERSLTSLARHTYSCSIRTIFTFLRSSQWFGYCLAS